MELCFCKLEDWSYILLKTLFLNRNGSITSAFQATASFDMKHDSEFYVLNFVLYLELLIHKKESNSNSACHVLIEPFK